MRIFMHRFARWTLVLVSLTGGASAQTGSASGLADAVQSFNQTVRPAPGTKDVSETLFPKLAALQPPPAAPATIHDISLMTTSSPEWAKWETWATGSTQKDVLVALATVTDPKQNSVLALGYGREAAKPEWIAPGLYVDLGTPALLAAAPSGMKYLTKFDQLAALCSVEAARLAAAKKPDECMKLLVSWVRLGRIVADRPFAKEKLWGIATMRAALERTRDIACSNPGLFQEKHIKESSAEFDQRAIAPERIRFPAGEKAAALQLAQLTIQERAGVKPEAFGPMIASMKARGRPLELFGLSTHWAKIGETHAGWFDTLDEINKVFGDWEQRWNLNDIFDRIHRQPTAYSKLDHAKFAIVSLVTEGIEPFLSDSHTLMVTDLRGTRAALGVVGFKSVQGTWPPALAAVQPRFVPILDFDPWFFEPRREVRQNFQFFVPMRDIKPAERELPKPHKIQIGLSGPAAAEAKDGADAQKPKPASQDAVAGFEARLGKQMVNLFREATTTGVPSRVFDKAAGKVDLAAAKTFFKGQIARLNLNDADTKNVERAIDALDEATISGLILALESARSGPLAGTSLTVEVSDADFVLYSVGADGRADFASKVGQGGTDILIWPPQLTLERRAQEQGLLPSASGDSSLTEDTSLLKVSALAELSPKVYDATTGKVDVELLRKELKSRAAQEEITPEVVAAITVIFAMHSQGGLGEQLILDAAADQLKGPVLDAASAARGLTPAEYLEYTRKSTKAMLSSPTFKSLSSKVAGGAELTTDDVRKFIEDTVDATLIPELIDPYIKKMLAHFSKRPAASK